MCKIELDFRKVCGGSQLTFQQDYQLISSKIINIWIE